MFYLLFRENQLWNIYTSLPEGFLLPEGIRIEQVETLPDGIEIGKIRRSDGSWVYPHQTIENWQAFMNKLDVPERGGNGGYAEALASPAMQDAMQAYTLALLFVRGVAREQEKLTLFYHLQEVVNKKPELLPKLQEALVAGNIDFSPRDPNA